MPRRSDDPAVPNVRRMLWALAACLDALAHSSTGRSLRWISGRAFEEAAGVLAPVWCLGCGAEDLTVCADCGEQLKAATRVPFSAEDAAFALPLVEGAGAADRADLGDFTVMPVEAAARYQGLVSRAILAFKDHELIHCDRLLGPGLHRAVHSMRRRASSSSGAPPLLVAPPQSLSARIRRSHHPVEHLLSSSGLRPARGLVTGTLGAWVGAVRPGSPHQKGRGMVDRRRRLADTLRVTRAGAALLDGAEVILVDDVLTTGSTLREMHRVLTDAGARVLGGAVLAAASRPAASASRPSVSPVRGEADLGLRRGSQTGRDEW